MEFLDEIFAQRQGVVIRAYVIQDIAIADNLLLAVVPEGAALVDDGPDPRIARDDSLDGVATFGGLHNGDLPKPLRKHPGTCRSANRIWTSAQR